MEERYSKIKIALTILFTFAFSLSSVIAQNDTMYVMKSGVIIDKYNLSSEVDSIIYYQPPVSKEEIPVFSSNFEDGDLISEYDSYVDDVEDGTLTVVRNPEPDEVNSSNYCVRARTTANYYGDDRSHSRAEYHNTKRMDTEGHEHIFQWDVYFPEGWLDNIKIYNKWLIISQFWTEPCSKDSNSDDSYYDIFYDNIAYTGGIFNDILTNTDGSEPVFEFEFRAKPDQNIVSWSFNEGVWQTITLQIYWTTDDDGYYNLYIDGSLLESQSNVQTLPTGWVESACGLRWKVGQYSSWKSSSKSYLTCYFDNVEWYIDADLESIMDK